MKRDASIKEKKSKKKKLGFSRSTLFLGEKKEQKIKNVFFFIVFFFVFFF